VVAISQTVYRANRSYAWNYGHSPSLPRIRRMPPAQGARLFDRDVASRLGIAAGPLLNAKWIAGYARLGYDILTYPTVTSAFRPAYTLPNIRLVESREQAAVALRRPHANGVVTLAVSLGMPSMEPDVWRKDVRRAKDALGPGQILVVSVAGSLANGGDAEALIADYARCATWAADAGADVIEVHLATPDPFAEHVQMIFENVPLSAQILYRVRTSIGQPIVAKLGMFRAPRMLHETATKLAPWTNGFALVHGVVRRVVDEEGKAAFEGAGRDLADVVGAETFAVCARQVEEMLAWRKAGAWDRVILGVGGITSVERALHVLHEGADAALVATAALVDPLFATRYRQAAPPRSEEGSASLPTNGASPRTGSRSASPREVRRQSRRSKRPTSRRRRKQAVR
jgi:dihydroorotate dehydrogenase (NAD+) catalytic subunit